MNKIYKYTLSKTGRQVVVLPKGFTILDIQVQHLDICLWAIVDPNNEEEDIVFTIYGTGDTLPTKYGEYVKTFQLANGDYVFHVFMER